LSERSGDRLWGSEPFAVPFLAIPVGLGTLALVASAKPGQAIVYVLEVVVPFVVGAFWVRRARNAVGALLRGTAVGLVAGITLIADAHLRPLRVDGAMLGTYGLAAMLCIVGFVCSGLALTVRWLLRRDRQTPF